MVTTARRYNGNAWQDATVRRWDGSAWLDVYPTAPATPGVVGTTSGGRSASGTGSFTVPLPPGAASYLAAVATSEPNQLGAPSGWSLVSNLGDSGYRLYRSTSTSPGTSWQANYLAAVIVIGYDAPINVSTPAVSRSLTSPSTQASGPALVFHGVADLNDSTTGTIGYPAGDTEGRVQRVQPEPGNGWSASVAAAAHARVTSGATGTATWTVPASWQPAAWTALITLA